MEILSIVLAVVAAGLAAAWAKWGKALYVKASQYDLVKKLVEALQDGDLTEAEIKEILEEIKELVLSLKKDEEEVAE